MTDFTKILIANRGEIARRIMRTARQMGFTCSVVYTSEEKEACFVKEADEAYDLGEGSLHDTYLNISKIIDIALRHKIEAIHPGYGFLSENFLFAKACEENNLIFIGPTSENIRQMSRKTEARKFVHSLGIPLPVSIEGENAEDILKKSNELSFPVLVKAASGGGGKGMRIVYGKKELKSALEAAQREAYSLFGDPMVYVEELLEPSRHIEVQVLGDTHGNVVHLFDRECSVQRRHQKIIEEAPSSTMSDPVREQIFGSAIQIARKMGYVGAGTIEFLLDEQQQFYFLEMNTRIQVEHAVTEEITGIDIVREQFQIASGKPLSFQQEDISCRGYAIECRVYAENPFSGFLPSTGKITTYYEPEDESVRIDSSIEGPASLSSSFDPMIAKVISHAPSREGARIKLLGALKQYVVHGIETNLNYLAGLISHPGFIQNRVSTSFCNHTAKSLHNSHHKRLNEISTELIAAAFLIFAFSWTTSLGLGANLPVWQSLGPWRNFMVTELDILGKSHTLMYKKHVNASYTLWVDNGPSFAVKGHRVNDSKIEYSCFGHPHTAFITQDASLYHITIEGMTFSLTERNILNPENNNQSSINSHQVQQEVLAPLTGKITKVNIKTQDMVNKGDILMVVESMKMENHILAPREGRIARVLVNTGDKVTGQEVLAVLT